MNEQVKDPAFERLLEFLKTNRGFDFTGYKRSSLMRRVHRRMQAVEIDSFEDYHDYLEVHPEEFAYLFNTILINVTSFFRDREAWDYLREDVIPQVIETNPEEGHIRIWSAGCAAGEEAYSLAMLFAEELGVEACVERVKVYATDVDEDALAHARQASYRPEALEPVPEDMREKYFNLEGGTYTFRNDLRRTVIFGRHDLIQDAPISRLDLLACRNTLIYLNAETQRHVLARFHFALNDDGFLFLGKAEMLLTHSNLFRPVNFKYRVFTKATEASRQARMMALRHAGNDNAADELGTYVRLQEAAFQVGNSAQVVIDQEGNLVLANERARALFELDPRDIGRPFQDLEMSYRPVELRAPIERAQSERRSVTLEDVERPRPEDEDQHLDIKIVPLRNNGDRLLGVSVTFEDVTDYYELREDLNRSKQELETAYEELQSTNEELETTNEELQSTVEELQTTNEELQSSNEEMETMNEELRTTNEELQTKNTALRESKEQLNQTRLFLESILASVNAGIVVVDRDFEILLWNEKAEDLWGLRAEEVRERSLLSLDIGLPVDKLADPIRATFSDEEDNVKQELKLEATNRRGQTIQVDITNTLRRSEDGEVEGVVLMMQEVDGEAQRDDSKGEE